MKSRRLPILIPLVLVLLSSGSNAFPSPVPQNKRSNSDADINSIGHRTITHDTNFYSPAQEKALGEQNAEKVKQTSKLLNDPAISEYVARVAQKVATKSDAHFRITVAVIDSENVDAFTLPGGFQYLSRGLLLRLEAEGELASLLARGIAHTALRSATREATRSQIMQLATIPSVPTGTTSGGVELSIPLAVLKMRRDSEMDADYFGLQYLYEAGYDPKCFTDTVERIWGKSPASVENVPKFFSTFPPLDERLAALRKEIAEILPSKPDAFVTTPDFDAFKARLRTLQSNVVP